jgi:hypothetical protein
MKYYPPNSYREYYGTKSIYSIMDSPSKNHFKLAYTSSPCRNRTCIFRIVPIIIGMKYYPPDSYREYYETISHLEIQLISLCLFPASSESPHMSGYPLNAERMEAEIQLLPLKLTKVIK